ncbi:MAG TPA: hypothetical protein VGL81_22165 [Polyangiaceae bacterium]|jgi:hypothetical protein
MTSHRFIPPFVTALLVILSGGNASAQNIAASGQPYPNRLVNGMNLGFSTRPENLTPLGVSAQDCLQDMTLQFSVTLSGFTGNDTVQVWGSTGSDCTALTDRGIGATTSKCWGLAGNVVDPIINTPQTYSFNVRVQDLVGWQQTPPLVTEAALPPTKGKEACSAQPTFAAVPMKLNFLAVDSSGNVQGTPYQYSITTDLVGPPAPAGLQVSTTGADLLASWTPNSDEDTIGYDVFFASAPAPDGQAGCAAPSLASPLGTGGGGDGGAGGAGLTVSDPTVGSYDLGAAHSDTQASVVVEAVDGLGNVGSATSPACDSVGTVEADAPGVACAVAAPGEPGSALPCLGLLGVAWAMTRRTRRSPS